MDYNLKCLSARFYSISVVIWLRTSDFETKKANVSSTKRGLTSPSFGNGLEPPSTTVVRLCLVNSTATAEKEYEKRRNDESISTVAAKIKRLDYEAQYLLDLAEKKGRSRKERVFQSHGQFERPANVCKRQEGTG